MAALAVAVGRLRRMGTGISWALPSYEPSLTPPWVTKRSDDEDDPQRGVVTLDPLAPRAAAAVKIRALVAQRKSEAALSKLGVRVEHVRPGKRPVAASPLSPDGPTSTRGAGATPSPEPGSPALSLGPGSPEPSDRTP
jgi:hypothetical protein